MKPLLRAQWWALGVAMLLSLTVLFGGPYNDDYIHLAILRSSAPNYNSDPTRLYEFTRGAQHTHTIIDQGMLPWWTSTTFKLRFFRPLSSLLVSLDHYVGQGSGTFGLVHGLLWFAVLLLLAASLFRETLPDRSARDATWAYALAGHHASPIVWISARNSLVSAAFSLFSMLLYIRARRSERSTWLSCCIALLALLSGETALGIFAYLVLWECLVQSDSPRARVRAILPFAALLVLYLCVYVAGGFGAAGSSGYLHPISDFAVWIRVVPKRLFALLGDPILQLPSDASLVSNTASTTLALLGLGAATLGAFALWFVARKESRSEANIRLFFALSFALAVVPGTAALPGGRVLPVAGLGAAVVVANILAMNRERRTQRGLARAGGWLLTGVMAFAMYGLGPAWRLLQVLGSAHVAASQAKLSQSMDWDCQPDSDLLLVSAPDPSIGMYAPAILGVAGRKVRTARVLSMAQSRLRITRTGSNEIELETLDAQAFVSSPLEKVYRSEQDTFAIGQRVQLTGMIVEVLALSGGSPTRVRMSFDRPLDPPNVCAVAWQKDRLARVILPPLHGSVELPHDPGPMGL